MIRKILRVGVLILIFLAAACNSSSLSSNSDTVEKEAVLNLVCGSENQENCVSKLCDHADTCPLINALSIKAVFGFVKTYSECKDCNTPVFTPELGIGKCIEYLVSKNPTGWTITFWVSENCSFRYGSPGESRIVVKINSETLKMASITPPVEYLENPLYCQTNADCYCLSGSGVSFIGCSNYFYAPLNLSGYYPGKDCGCKTNQCVGK